jgi:hypothetical protein
MRNFAENFFVSHPAADAAAAAPSVLLLLFMSDQSHAS